MDAEERIARLEEELQAIKERNMRVETNKAWEGSKTRVVSIAIFTYAIALIILIALHASFPLYAAFVPVAGFYLSTLSFPYIRRSWEMRKGLRPRREKFHAED